MATAGSVAGCLAIYYIAEKGGEAFLRKRLKAGHVDRALALYRRHGVLALMVPALLPPPAPFKLFVLAAGVADVRPWQFVWAIAVARGARYLALGILAIYYGEAALELMRTHGRVVALWLVAFILVAAALWWLRARRQARSGRPAPRERGAVDRHPAVQRGTERRASSRGAVASARLDGRRRTRS